MEYLRLWRRARTVGNALFDFTSALRGMDDVQVPIDRANVRHRRSCTDEKHTVSCQKAIVLVLKEKQSSASDCPPEKIPTALPDGHADDDVQLATIRVNL